MTTHTPRRSRALYVRRAVLCLFAVAALFAPGRARAQWTTADANNNISSTNTGNVGIGTSNPANGKVEITADTGVADGEHSLLYASKSGTSSGGFRLGYRADGTAATGGYVRSLNNLSFFLGTTGAPLAATIANNGYFGLGTTAPLSNLDVNGPHTSTQPQLQIRNGTTTARTRIYGDDAVGMEMWKNGTPTAASYVGMQKPGTALTDDFIFSTYNATSSWAERLRILNSNGNVGIGTATPAQKLDVAGSVNASGLCLAGDCKTAWSQVGGAASQWTNNSSNIYFNTGNVGVGISNPIAKLDVRGGADTALLVGDRGMAGSVGLEFLGSNYKHGALRFDGDNIIIENGSNSVTPSTWYNGQPMNFIVRNGNVGIGTTNPGSNLFVGSGTPAVQTLAGVNVALGGNSYVSASNGTINTFLGSDISTYGIVGTLSNHPLGLRANNTLAVTVMPSGNVGIGTASPAAKLDVAGNVSVTGDITATGNIAAKYQDVAEWVPSTQKLAAGTVVVLDRARANHVTASTTSYDTAVAGVVSERPGLILGEGGGDKVMVATTGRVRVRVDATAAPIQIGDLLVTSDETGVAMKSEPVSFGARRMHAPGTIIGKALEALPSGKGEILVLLSLQ